MSSEVALRIINYPLHAILSVEFLPVMCPMAFSVRHPVPAAGGVGGGYHLSNPFRGAVAGQMNIREERLPWPRLPAD